MYIQSSSSYLLLVALQYQVTSRMTQIAPANLFLVIHIPDFVSIIHKLCAKIMKGDRKRRACGFKNGHKLYHKRVKVENDNPCEAIPVQYVRPTREEQLLMENPPIKPESLAPIDPQGPSDRHTMFLRSKFPRPSTSGVEPDNNS